MKPVKLHAFWRSLTQSQRHALADACGWSPRGIEDLLAGRTLGLASAMVLVAQTDGALTIDDIPLTEEAQRQLDRQRRPVLLWQQLGWGMGLTRREVQRLVAQRIQDADAKVEEPSHAPA